MYSGDVIIEFSNDIIYTENVNTVKRSTMTIREQIFEHVSKYFRFSV